MFAPAGKLGSGGCSTGEETSGGNGGRHRERGGEKGNGPGQKWVVKGRRGEGEGKTPGSTRGREEDSFSSATPGQNRRSLESNY